MCSGKGPEDTKMSETYCLTLKYYELYLKLAKKTSIYLSWIST